MFSFIYFYSTKIWWLALTIWWCVNDHSINELHLSQVHGCNDVDNVPSALNNIDIMPTNIYDHMPGLLNSRKIQTFHVTYMQTHHISAHININITVATHKTVNSKHRHMCSYLYVCCYWKCIDDTHYLHIYLFRFVVVIISFCVRCLIQ